MLLSGLDQKSALLLKLAALFALENLAQSAHFGCVKVLFDHPQPFSLAHGGVQIQIEQTKSALEKVGVEVEYVRWWDDSQRADIVHYFGRPSAIYIDLAHGKGMKVVMAELLSELGARSPIARLIQRMAIRLIRRAAPGALANRMAWDSFRLADACIALTPWEGALMSSIFQAPPERVHWIANGVETVFLESKEATRGSWLVCTATIRSLKRVLEVAEAAVHAQTPLWVLGKPYGEQDPYALRFLKFAKQHPSVIRYEGALSDRSQLARIYREARGFVLLSTNESLSLSALEAAACGCPLLMSDLPWARTVFGQHASYCSVRASTSQTAAVLRRFYDEAPQKPLPPKPLSWLQVAEALKAIYLRVLGSKR
jgi:glycosyltransferase involved in cell wall biosynthesis